VIPARMLVGYLLRRPARLSRAQVEEAHALVAHALVGGRSRGRAVSERWQLIR
jgi:hypothetical protein